MDAWKNQLFFGDNLEILRSGRIPVGSVGAPYSWRLGERQ